MAYKFRLKTRPAFVRNHNIVFVCVLGMHSNYALARIVNLATHVEQNHSTIFIRTQNISRVVLIKFSSDAVVTRERGKINSRDTFNSNSFIVREELRYFDL